MRELDQRSIRETANETPKLPNERVRCTLMHSQPGSSGIGNLFASRILESSIFLKLHAEMSFT